jgi:hypothetical protein
LWLNSSRWSGKSLALRFRNVRKRYSTFVAAV